MNFLKIILLILFVFLNSKMFGNSINEHDSIPKLKYGISMSPISVSWFYDDKFNRDFDFWSGANFDFQVNIVAFKKIDNKNLNLVACLSTIRKSATSEGGVPYSFQSISFAPMIGYEYNTKTFITKTKVEKIISFGPFVGYLYNARKGKFKVEDEHLKNYEYGIELLYSQRVKDNPHSSRTSFVTTKLQVGLSDVLYFKTISLSGSLVGFMF